MEIWGEISRSALRRVAEVLFFSAMFALPWINKMRVSTFLFFTLGGILFLGGAVFINYSWYKKQILFWLFLSYYAMQVFAFFIYHHDAYVYADIERKAAFIFIPFLLYVLTTNYRHIWQIGVKGFIYGNVTAAIFCFIYAIVRYIISRNIEVFFYHEYARLTGSSAIYFSFYLLIALGYIILKPELFKGRTIVKIIAFFLYVSILLLSSKMLIVAGTLLLIIPLFKSARPLVLKTGVVFLGICISAAIACTGNPIKKRYADIHILEGSSVLNNNNFSNYIFDGLSIRLLLWRLGTELVKEKRMWIWGAGGERYHSSLNSKIIQYRVYSGNGNSDDQGYQNYNMHDQYIESYLQFGIVGVILLTAMLACIIHYSVRFENRVLSYTVILFSFAFVTESALETQSGILLFIIITSGEWIQSQKKKLTVQS